MPDSDSAPKSTPVPAAELPPIEWRRVPLEKAVLQRITARSDWRGGLQTLSFLALLTLTGTTAQFSLGRWPWWVTLLLVCLHGAFWPFLLNGFHELCHQTVFRTRALNQFFVRLFGLLGWYNVYHFTASHMRHHQFTLHPPRDLEVVLPIRLTRAAFFKTAFINRHAVSWMISNTMRMARGRLAGDWELTCFPVSDHAARRRLASFARATLLFHTLVLGVALWRGWWLVPLLVTFAPLHGGWLNYLVNNTQHVGLRDHVDDFRLCCRTIAINPFLRFLYWHMNFHIEHHMYAGVPCYNLRRLHAAIRHALPPTPNGLVATWRHIGEIVRRQQADPAYQYDALR